MKRINNIYAKVCSIENLNIADNIARKGKAKQPGIIAHDKNREANILALHYALINKTYKTSPYSVFTIFERKERIISKLPYIDRIVHHSVMIELEAMFVANFTADTYSCIKGRGIHAATYALREMLNDVSATTYCLKLDVKKFYPSIDHDTLKMLLRRKIKDNDLLWLLDGIIDSADGLPIGNYLSQYFANFYLSPLDHYVKEQLKVKMYLRYADDMVILSNDKKYLHQVLFDLKEFLENFLKLKIKENYQVFPVEKRGIDFVGYVTYHDHVLLRKSIKQSFARSVAKNKNQKSIASYIGWAKHCNSINLINKLTTDAKV